VQQAPKEPATQCEEPQNDCMCNFTHSILSLTGTTRSHHGVFQLNSYFMEGAHIDPGGRCVQALKPARPELYCPAPNLVAQTFRSAVPQKQISNSQTESRTDRYPVGITDTSPMPSTSGYLTKHSKSRTGRLACPARPERPTEPSPDLRPIGRWPGLP
jgi:hypothetical protein